MARVTRRISAHLASQIYCFGYSNLTNRRTGNTAKLAFTLLPNGDLLLSDLYGSQCEEAEKWPIEPAKDGRAANSSTILAIAAAVSSLLPKSPVFFGQKIRQLAVLALATVARNNRG